MSMTVSAGQSAPCIWIDTDIALGAAGGDVDDGFALAAVLAAVRQGTVKLMGVSMVNGNTDAATAMLCAGALLHLSGLPTVPLIPAAHAASRIAALDSGTSLLALGPLTNIAAALQLNPECSATFDLRMVGAVRTSWRAPLLMLSDLNQKADRAAARQTRAARWQRLRIMPLDVVQHLRIDRSTLDRIAATGEVGGYLRTHSERWLARAAWRHPLLKSFPAWDLVAAMDAIGALDDARFDPQTHMLVRFNPLGTLNSFVELLSSSGRKAHR